MGRRRFFFWSAVGAAFWVGVVTLLGFFLGQAFPGLQDKLELMIIIVIVVSLIPAAIEWWRHRRARTPTPKELEQSQPTAEELDHH